MKIKNLSRNSVLGPKICVGLLGVLALAMLCPLTNNIPEVNAEGTARDVESTLSLTVDGADQAATPAEVGTVAYRYNNVTVAANAYKNYTLTLSAMLGSGSELHGKNNPNATIAGVGTNVAPSAFGDNKWGYAVTNNTSTDGSALTYSTVPNYGGTAATLASKNVPPSPWAARV